MTGPSAPALREGLLVTEVRAPAEATRPSEWVPGLRESVDEMRGRRTGAGGRMSQPPGGPMRARRDAGLKRNL